MILYHRIEKGNFTYITIVSRRDNVLHLFGPCDHKTEPAASLCDELAVFCFYLVAVGIDLLSHLQYLQQTATEECEGE